MKPRPSRQKINLKVFKEIFYRQRLSNKEVAEKFGVGVSAIGSFRHRHNLPPRGWAKHPPMLGKRHSEESKRKMSLANKGKNLGATHHNWKGGYYLDIFGYKWVLSKRYGLPSAHGYIKEHRLVIQNHLGRKLSPYELVHHKNGDKLDNRIENLCIHTRSSHAKHHFPKGSKFGIHAHE